MKLLISLILIFIFTVYHVNYKPAMESFILYKTMQTNHRSLMDLLQHFDRALSYNTYGDVLVRFKMVDVATVIMRNEIFNQYGAVEFVQFTAQEMRKQVESFPNELKHLVVLTNLLNNMARFDAQMIPLAEKYILKCIALSPNHPQAYFILADNFLLKGDIENAKRAIKKGEALKDGI